jgi:hypothetical protein
MDTEHNPKELDDENLPVNRHDYERADRNYGREYVSMWTNDADTNDGDEDNDDMRRLALASRSSTQTFDKKTKQNGANGNSSETLKNYAVAIDKSVASATSHRRFFRTQKGYMGLGPESMKERDKVFVLDGGSVPFLLRPAGNKEIPKLASGRATHWLETVIFKASWIMN